MPPSADAINRITEKLDLKVPPIAVYDCPASEAFEPIVSSKGRACCFAYYDRWLEGKTLVISKSSGGFANPTDGCPGAQAAFGMAEEYPPFMAHFLTDGVGAPMGEGLKATPELAQEAHGFVRERLRTSFGGTADRIRIQYGGSVKPSNSYGLMAQPDIDGALVGGASLDPESFFAIIQFDRPPTEETA